MLIFINFIKELTQKIKQYISTSLHIHVWKGSGWNAWSIEIEQRCKCGKYRHHYSNDVVGFGQPQWHDGPHQLKNPDHTYENTYGKSHDN